jgi:hypothetical protein
MASSNRDTCRTRHIRHRCHCVHFQISNSAHVILKIDDTLNILDAGTKLQDFATFICHCTVIHDEVPT